MEAGKFGLRHDIATLLNIYSAENGSDTPDWILAEFLENCLKAFDKATNQRTEWFKPSEEA